MSATEPTPPNGRLATTFRAFTFRDFRLLWAGAFTSSVGTWMQEVAQNWLVLTISGSAFLLGLDAFLGDVPFLLFSLFGGVLADRVDRRRILLASQYVQMASAFALAAMVATGTVGVPIILALSFVVGFAQSFGGPAYQALVPTLVPKADMPNAVALNSIQFNLARVIGPVLAGIAFHRYGAGVCFALNGLSFLAVIAALLSLRGGAPLPTTAPKVSVLTSLKEGLRAVRDDRALRGLTGLAFLTSFGAIPVLTLLPLIARDVFHEGAQRYASLLAAFGIGAVVGAVGIAGLSHLGKRGPRGVALQVAYGVLTAAFAFSRNLWLSWTLLFFAGAALMGVFALFMTLVQTSVEDSLRGRVVSVYALAFRGAMPLGNIVAGAVASTFPVTAVLAVDGVGLALIGLYVLMRRSPGGVTSL
jgi:MFS family permease